MPLVYRVVGPKKVSNGKLELKGKTDSEFIAVNNETLVNVLRQLASVVTHAGDIFSDVTALTEQVGKRVRSVKLRLDELEAKTDLFDPRLVPVRKFNKKILSSRHHDDFYLRLPITTQPTKYCIFPLWHHHQQISHLFIFSSSQKKQIKSFAFFL